MRFDSLDYLNGEYRLTFKTTSQAEVNKAVNNISLFGFTEDEIEEMQKPVEFKVNYDNGVDVSDIEIKKNGEQITLVNGDSAYTAFCEDSEKAIMICLLKMCGLENEDLKELFESVK